MTYTTLSDSHGGHGTLRSDPATTAVKLTSTMVSDTADLSIYAKALRVYNGSASAITLMVTPLKAQDSTSSGAIPITVPVGGSSWEPISARRIWLTGSTGLTTALDAGTAEVILATE